MTSSTFTVELYWKCLHRGPRGLCGHINLGRASTCSSCHFERTIDCLDCLKDGTPVGVSFTVTDDQASPVTDASVQEVFDRGETWICEIDEVDNRSTGDPAKDICSRCCQPRFGAGMDRGKAEQVMLTEDFDEGRAHEHDADISDGPGAVDPFTGKKEKQTAYDKIRKVRRNESEPCEPADSDLDRAHSTRSWILFAAVIVICYLLFGLWWLLASHPVHVSVTDVSWSRTLRLERRSTLSGQGWGSPPLGSFNSSCSLRDTGRTRSCQPYSCNPHSKQFQIGSHKCNPHSVQRQSGTTSCGTERVACGSEEYGCSTNCTRNRNGSGSCTRSCSTRTKYCDRTKYCPTYRTDTEYDNCPDYETRIVYDTCYHQCPVLDDYCLYLYYVWTTADTKQEGGHNLQPKWPELIPTGETERLRRDESYSVVLSNKNKSWTYSCPTESDFSRFTIGTKWVVDVNRAGMVSNPRTEAGN